MFSERYRTVREVADLLKVSEVTFRRRIKGGNPRAIDIGKGWRIGSHDLDSFVDGHAARPAAAAANAGGRASPAPRSAREPGR